MLWILVCVGAGIVGWGVWEWAAAQRSPYRPIGEDAALSLVRRMAERGDLPNVDFGQGVLAAVTGGSVADIPTRKHRASPTATAAAAGSTAAIVEFADWWHVDDSVLRAVEQWTGQNISNGMDLWSVAHDEGYRLWTGGFETKLRGHVGEQEVFSQLNWAGDSLSVPQASNNPDSDLTLGGHEFNIKVSQDVSAIREHLERHPDIPVVVNADMSGELPADAIHVDLSQPIDPSILADHSVVVADGLTLSDLHETVSDAFGAPLGNSPGDFDVSDAFDLDVSDAVPGLGAALVVIRSGIREGRLARHHGSAARAVKNVARDTTIVGGAAVAGSFIGRGLGAAVDVATLGATAGFGSMVGSFLGAAAGGFFGNQAAREERMRPLAKAREVMGDLVHQYAVAAEHAVSRANEELTERRIPEIERDLEEIKAILNRRLRNASINVERNLRVVEESFGRAVDDAVADELARNRPVGRGLLARRSATKWRAAASDVGGVPLERRLAVLAAADEGTRAQALLAQASAMRAHAVALYLEQHRRADLVVTGARSLAAAKLSSARHELEVQVERDSYPHAVMVYLGAMWVREEIVNTGAKGEQWVEVNIPAPDLPARPQADGDLGLVTNLLARQDGEPAELPLALVDILVDGLPEAAASRSWWAYGDRSAAWRSAGYTLEDLDLDEGVVRFSPV